MTHFHHIGDPVGAEIFYQFLKGFYVFTGTLNAAFLLQGNC